MALLPLSWRRVCETLGGRNIITVYVDRVPNADHGACRSGLTSELNKQTMTSPGGTRTGSAVVLRCGFKDVYGAKHGGKMLGKCSSLGRETFIAWTRNPHHSLGKSCTKNIVRDITCEKTCTKNPVRIIRLEKSRTKNLVRKLPYENSRWNPA